MKMLRRLPRLLRFMPGTAQDVRAYFLTLQYWLAGSDDNIANMVRLLVDRYADGPRRGLRGTVAAAAPTEYPDIGVYHPSIKGRIAERADKLPAARGDAAGTVGLLVMRSYVLAGNAGALRRRDRRARSARPARHPGLRQRARRAAGRRTILPGQGTADDRRAGLPDRLLAGRRAGLQRRQGAEDMLASLDVPYLAAHPLEFQTLEQWEASERGLLPVESTIMVAIPELDGATGPTVFGGRSAERPGESGYDMRVHPERAAMLAARVAKLVALRRTARAERKIAIPLFNFPPNAGNIGTAAYLAVFESLHRTLAALQAAGYSVDVPASVDALRAGRSSRATRRASAAWPTSHARIAGRAIMCAASAGCARSKQQWGTGAGPPAERRRVALRARRAVRQRVRRHPAGLRLRGRSDAPAVREGLRADPRLLRLLSLDRARISAPTPCCISARMARSNSCPASRPAFRARAGPTG